MKRLKIIDHGDNSTFYIYTRITMYQLKTPVEALDILKPILNSKDVHHFEAFFGSEWVTSSEL